MYTLWAGDWCTTGYKWVPTDYDTKAELLTAIKGGNHRGTLRITLELGLDVEDMIVTPPAETDCNMCSGPVCTCDEDDEPIDKKLCKYTESCTLGWESCAVCVYNTLRDRKRTRPASCPACGRPDGECVCHGRLGASTSEGPWPE
ncbi:hypothetical protein LCGC14_0846970 [marine sediment metagenome]|uniref:Uncharacterized protein n=1 Tax=marine sediment metagenome TaxID=412755 RepID=A0A0F9PWN8_9ZZZZ